MSDTRSSPVLYPVAQEQIQPNLPPPPPPPLPSAQQQQQQSPSTSVAQQQPQPPPPPLPPQPQQRVHVIKKNIYLMASSPGNNGCTTNTNVGNGGSCGTTSQMVSFMVFTLSIKMFSKHIQDFIGKCICYAKKNRKNIDVLDVRATFVSQHSFLIFR